jgi:hypothetical protein
LCPYRGWGPYLLQFIEQGNLANLYNYTLNWYDPGNGNAISFPLKIINCPSAPSGRTNQVVGTIGAEGDYFALNSVQAYWWPAAQQDAACDEVQAAAAPASTALPSRMRTITA